MSWWKRWSILDSGLWEITRWGPQVPGLVLWGDRPSTTRVYPWTLFLARELTSLRLFRWGCLQALGSRGIEKKDGVLVPKLLSLSDSEPP